MQSVIIHNFYVVRISVPPHKADAVLVVDADAVLADTVALECLEAVARRNSKVVEPTGDLELAQLSPGDGLEGHETPDALSAGECFGI